MNSKNIILMGTLFQKMMNFFSEYSRINRLKNISNFSGSAGFAVILENKSYLFVDGRYTLQAQIESSNYFKITEYSKIFDCKLFKNRTIGFDPKLFTSNQIKKFFHKNNKIKMINSNLIDKMIKKKSFFFSKPFFSLDEKTVGENYRKKIFRIIKFLKKRKLDNIFISAPENVAWLLNIRGQDNPNSPIPNAHLILNKNKKNFLNYRNEKVKNLIKEGKINQNQIIEAKNFEKFIYQLKGKKICIDPLTCSVFFEKF